MKNAVGPRGAAPDGNDEDRADSTHGKAEAGLPPRGTPKNYLMAWLLVMLKDINLHGYEIMRALKDNFAVVSDPGTVYRALRQLERDGYITSWWDPKEQGPARRMYTLTDTGSDALKMWSSALEQYRTNLDAFFSLYTGAWTKEHPRSKPEE
ncbi:MAG: helix-turn-helix transcriptional regulator [Candidatus Eremiobacteraeota bacterium]|nr:helix-turn-helix transcriptional regulator [Candidatus Eremiobacteraeota bacterium]